MIPMFEDRPVNPHHRNLVIAAATPSGLTDHQDPVTTNHLRGGKPEFVPSTRLSDAGGGGQHFPAPASGSEERRFSWLMPPS